jgi:hypothetical protein
MIFNKTQGKFLHGVIDQWADDQTIAQETADLLRQSFSIRPFDWKKLAKYSFWIAITCFVIAVGSVLADRALLRLLRLFSTCRTACAVWAWCCSRQACFISASAAGAGNRIGSSATKRSSS